MGNSPSKNASPNTHTSNNSSLTGTTSTLTTSGEPEPDDRKSSSSNQLINKQYRKDTNKFYNDEKLHYKLQKNKLSKSPKKFTYYDGNGDGGNGNDDFNSFDMDIQVSMAKALKPRQNSNSTVSDVSNSTIEDFDLPQGSTTDEISSSFSDLFTLESKSNSSSLSTTPPFKNNPLPPIVEEPKNSIHKRKPKIGPNDVDIDSIIEKLLTPQTLNTSNSSPTLGFKKDEFFIKPHEISIICSKVREIFLQQPNLLKLSAPVKIVGDIHGQFNDLLRILKLSGLPPNSNYLFLGDYVDRGKQSLETILLLFCFKIKYPENFFMLRGNHECANINKIYGFYDECKRRLNLKVWKNFIDVFNTLPISAIINDKIFCIHGGLSPNLTNLKQIENLKRPTDIPEVGLFADLLWSDPDSSISEWNDNDRGVSYCFGKKIVENFCKKFKFDLIIRGHMVVEDGYEFFARKKLVTIFSAPNYCGEFNNWGAVMSVDTGLLCSFELLKPNKKITSS